MPWNLPARPLRRDVLNEPMEPMRLGGLDPVGSGPGAIPRKKYYNQPHFMPDHTQSRTLLTINRARTTTRAAELACYQAFRDLNGLYPGGPAPGLQPAQQLPVDSGDPAGFGAGEERVSLMEEQISRIAAQVASRLFVEVEASAATALTKDQAMTLFGHGLTPKRPLSQPGQFVCQERVEVLGPKGSLPRWRSWGRSGRRGRWKSPSRTL